MSINGIASCCQNVLPEEAQIVPGNDTDKDEFYSTRNLQIEIEPGKILAFQHGSHIHYTLYIGYGKVMHTIVEDEAAIQAHIRVSSLQEVCHDGRVRVKHHDQIAQTHFQLNARSLEELLQVATAFKDKVVPFELDFRNCEYYCTLWRYGKGFITQAPVQNGFYVDGEYESYQQLEAIKLNTFAYLESV